MTSLVLAVLVLALTCNGCALDRYALDRVLDLSDVVDVKLGLGQGVGLKLEVTDYAGAGLGIGAYPWVLETFGRRAEITDMSFFHVLVFGLEHAKLPPHRQAFSRNYVFVQLADERPPPVDRFRIGLEVLLPFVSVGLSLNAGELIDFVAGLATIDLANDDGVRKGAELFPATDGDDPASARQPVTPLGIVREAFVESDDA